MITIPFSSHNPSPDRRSLVLVHEPAQDAEAAGEGISFPFTTLPINVYIRGPRYRVAFDHIGIPSVELR